MSFLGLYNMNGGRVTTQDPMFVYLPIENPSNEGTPGMHGHLAKTTHFALEPSKGGYRKGLYYLILGDKYTLWLFNSLPWKIPIFNR